MIGSHDTFTYLDSTSSKMNSITGYWRCQDKTVNEQYAAGVRYFDIRVMREVNESGKTIWRLCHGAAELTKTYTTLKSLFTYFTSILRGSMFEIWLEKGSDEDWEYFKNEITPLLENYNNVTQVVRKDPETVFYVNYYSPIKEVYQFNKWSFSDILSNPFNYIGNPIKKWAKKHNPTITQEMIDDKNVIYFMDYVCGVE